jgi:hypothetical protein
MPRKANRYGREQEYCHGTQVRTVTKNAYLAAERHIKCRAALPQSLLLRP